jgi:hypothetical protein
MCSTAYKKQWAPDRRSSTQQKLSLFTCVASHTKSKWLLIGGLLLSKNLTFYMHSTAHKKQGAPNQRSTHLLLFSAQALSRTKSKRAPDRRSTHLLLFSARASPRIKSNVLQGMCSKFIILLIKFSKVFTAQHVSSSIVWLYPKPHGRVS